MSSASKTMYNQLKLLGYLQGSRYKVHNTLDESDTKNYRANVAEIWEAGETFDPKTERLFRYLQVGRSCSFQWLVELFDLPDG